MGNTNAKKVEESVVNEPTAEENAKKEEEIAAENAKKEEEIAAENAKKQMFEAEQIKKAKKKFVEYEKINNITYNPTDKIRFYPVIFVKKEEDYYGRTNQSDGYFSPGRPAHYEYGDGASYISTNTNPTDSQMVELFGSNINVDIFETAFPKPSIKELNDSIDLLLTKNKDNLKAFAFFRQQYPEIYSNYTSFFNDYNNNFNKFNKSSADKEIMGPINEKYKEIIKELSKIPITKLFGEIYSEQDALKDDPKAKQATNEALEKAKQATNAALDKAKQAILTAVESPQLKGGKRRTRKNKNKKTKYKNRI